MPTSFACGSCGAQIRVTPAIAGKTGPCPRCKAPVRAPALTDSELSNTLTATRAAPPVDEPDPLERERLALELERAKVDLERAALERMRTDPEMHRPTPPKGEPAVEADVVELQASDRVSDVERRPCPDCGELIAKKAKVCRFCGWGKPDPNADPAVASPAITVAWSLLFPGLGHMHRGHPVAGVAILFATFMLLPLSWIDGLFCFVPLAVWPAAAWHATRVRPITRRGADPGCLLIAIVIIVAIAVAIALGR